MMRSDTRRGDSDETHPIGFWLVPFYDGTALCAAAAGNSVYVCAGFSEIAGGYLLG
jgi:hypothetical protein